MDAVASWFERPFRPEGSAAEWFLFFGLLIAISVTWRMILAHVLEDA